jgi:hypothetical protein
MIDTGFFKKLHYDYLETTLNLILRETNEFNPDSSRWLQCRDDY